MATIDEKFEKFNSIIINEAVKKRDSELEKLEMLKKQKLEQKENEILEKSYKIVQKGVAEARKSSNILSSQKPAEAKKEVLMYRNQLIDETFCELAKKIDEYRLTDEYFVKLCDYIELAESTLKCNDIVIVMDKKDSEYSNKIAEKYNAEVELSEIIGGVIVKSANAGKAFNFSYSEKISNLKQNFLNNVKFTIN